MLLQALTKYYDILSEDDKCNIPKIGYSSSKVSYAIVLSENGDVIDIISIKIPEGDKNKFSARSMKVPEQITRSSGISSNFLCDNASYFLGIDCKKSSNDEEKSKNKKRACDCFKECERLHKEILQNIHCSEAKAVLKFFEKWDYNKSEESTLVIRYLDDIKKGANFIFKIDGANSYIHQNTEIKTAWLKYKNSRNTLDNDKKICLVTGEKTNISRIHPALKGIYGGQSMGNPLICFNKSCPAYESYGNKDSQGFNSPVGEITTFKYATALNWMLADTSHKLYYGDSTLIYWAESKNTGYFQDMFSMLLSPDELDKINTDKQKYIRDESATKRIKQIFEKIVEGKKINLNQFDDNTKFYILALSPNAARLSIRFFYVNNFGNIIEKLSEHYINLVIEKQFDNEFDSIPLWKIMSETVSTKSTDKASSPLLSGMVLKSIILGSPYPVSLFNAIMIRIRAEHEINYYKASIIKAYLTRCSNYKKYEEVLVMSLNQDSKNRPYVLGRLFAVLEKAQQDASDAKLNTTIKDKYFTSACANPSNAFPLLLKLSNHHISKAKNGFYLDNKVKEIMELLDVNNNPFPKNLSMEEQGIFVLGYYHQKNNLYKKVEDK